MNSEKPSHRNIYLKKKSTVISIDIWHNHSSYYIQKIPRNVYHTCCIHYHDYRGFKIYTIWQKETCSSSTKTGQQIVDLSHFRLLNSDLPPSKKNFFRLRKSECLVLCVNVKTSKCTHLFFPVY